MTKHNATKTGDAAVSPWQIATHGLSASGFRPPIVLVLANRFPTYFGGSGAAPPMALSALKPPSVATGPQSANPHLELKLLFNERGRVSKAETPLNVTHLT